MPAGGPGTRAGTAKPLAHAWVFKARFRRGGFGWRSQPAIQRIKEAVSEIKKVARQDPVLGAEGAVIFLERLSPAIERIDGSSGSIGTAVNRAMTDLVPIIAGAPADAKTRGRWLDRLWAAHEEDGMCYIESLADDWGDLCASAGVASAWADELVGITAMALGPDKSLRGHFHGTTACLSSLYRAGRFQEIVDLVAGDCIWPYKRWGARAMAALGDPAAAIAYAESCRSPWASDAGIDAVCEEILLSSGQVDEAYRSYGVRADLGGTYLATFRSVARRYPHKPAREVLADLVATTPGSEAKWFAAAKEAGLYDEALDLASRSPCDPRTLTRAARDLAAKHPAFALGAGFLALHWLVRGHGYEFTGADVSAAYAGVMKAAECSGTVAEARQRVREILATEGPGGFVTGILARELG